MGISERKERERDEMRRRVLDTAMQLFLQEGYDNVSIRRIAEAIEYSPATIYLYFKEKDEILMALHNRAFEEFYKTLSGTDAIADPIARLRASGHAYISFALDNPEYYDLMFIMRAPMRPIEEGGEWTVGLQSYQWLRTTVAACIQAGAFKGVHLDVATFLVWSQVHGMVSLAIRNRVPMIPSGELRSLAAGALDVLMRGLEEEAAAGGNKRRVAGTVAGQKLVADKKPGKKSR